MLEKHTIAGLKSKAKNVAFDWIPPDVPAAIAAEYMQSLPPSKLPISGSDGALYRRQQLERQLPLHDLDATQCHQLTEAEVENLNKYLENLKSNVVGQGRVTKLGVPSSNSLDSLQKMCTFNSVPKPFQTSNGSSLSNPSTHFTVGDIASAGKVVNLKPPSAFWPKSLSPEPPRSLSPATCASDAPLPSVADRGAAFGVTLSPAKKPVLHNHNLTSERGRSSPIEDSAMRPNVDGHLVKEQVQMSLAQSADVQGNMWVPAECEECCRGAMGGQLVRDQICTHVAKSDDAPTHLQPMECSACIKKCVDSQLVRDRICTHLADSNMPVIQPMTCSKCIKTGVDGHLEKGEICTHLADSSTPVVLRPMTCSYCMKEGLGGQLVLGERCTHSADCRVPHLIQPQKCSECSQSVPSGALIRDQVCTHVAHEESVLGQHDQAPLITGRLPPGYGPSENSLPSYVQLSDASKSPKHQDHSGSSTSAHSASIQSGISLLPPPGWSSASSLPIEGNSTPYASRTHAQDSTVVPGIEIPPCEDNMKPRLGVTRERSPTSEYYS